MIPSALVDRLSPIDKSRFAEAVDLLVAAFDEDPFFRFLAPDDDERGALIRGVMRSNLEIAGVQGVARGAVGGSIDGVCLWFPPATYPPPASATLVARGRAVTQALGQIGRRRTMAAVIARALRMAALMDEAHPPEPYYYLQVLGVRPDRQGHGVGGAMMRAAVAQADRERRVSILETSKPANVPFYRRFGFEVVRATRLGLGSPPVWTMRRPLG